jgi:hypothetical protein
MISAMPRNLNRDIPTENHKIDESWLSRHSHFKSHDNVTSAVKHRGPNIP